MRTLWIFLLLASFVSQIQIPAFAQEGSSVSVLVFKWYKTRAIVEKLETPSTGPAAAMIPQNKLFERNRRANSPEGVRDPNLDTTDGRSAALERSIQESRIANSKPVDGFAYRVKVKNTSTKVIEVVFWEYQFKETADPSTLARRQFLCGVNIKPNKEKELQAFSLSGPSDVISVGSLAKKTDKLFDESIVINRIEYSDGTIWQRKGWNFSEVRLGIARAIGTSWGSEMCRSL